MNSLPPEAAFGYPRGDHAIVWILEMLPSASVTDVSMLKHRTMPSGNSCATGARVFWITAWTLLVPALSLQALAQPAAKPLPTLTHVEQIRRLTPEQAALGYPAVSGSRSTQILESFLALTRTATPGFWERV